MHLQRDSKIQSEKQALSILNDRGESTFQREKAARFVERHPSDRAIDTLVGVLADDDFGVRWAASTALAKLGDQAIANVLETLIHNYSPRLRESVYHILHYNQGLWTISHAGPLMEALKTTVPAITSPTAAAKMLAAYQREQR